MISNDYARSKTYDRVVIPDSDTGGRGRSASGTSNYLGQLRISSSGRPSSQTLQYSFDFNRGVNGRGRLAAVPGSLDLPPVVPKRDARTGGAPAGTPTGHGKLKADARRSSPTKNTAAGQKKAQHAKNAPRAGNAASRSSARPKAGTATDFGAVAPRTGGIKAPRLKDSMQELGLPSRTGKRPAQNAEGQPGHASGATESAGVAKQQAAAGRAGTASASPNGTSRKSGPSVAASLPQKHGWFHHVERPEQPPKPPSPKKLRKQAALRGLDPSETTVIGFDISRSVFSRPTKAPVDVSAPETKTKKRSALQKVGNFLSWVVWIALLFVMLTAALTMMARVSDLAQQNAEMERDNELLAEEVTKARMQVALEEDLSDIKNRAEELGLKQPEDEQIEYVDLGTKSQRAAVPGTDSSGEEKQDY